MAYTPLRDVNLSSQNWTIKVRVVRFCDVMKFQDAHERQKIHFVALDEEGTSMEAQVQDIWVKRSKTKLEEDHVYKIKYFRVALAKPTYKLVPHQFMIQFTAFTTIEEVTTVPANFPIYAHHAAPFAELQARINNDEFTSDVIGIITGCSAVRQQQTKANTQKSLRTLLITDGSETVPVSLWGQHADKFDAEYCVEAAKEKSVVILLCALTCRRFNDKLALNSSMLCTWYINPQLGEADALRQSMPPQPIQWLFGAQNNNQDEATTVAELASHKNPHIIYGKKFVVAARIKKISTTEMWWYLACNTCNKRLYDNGDSFKCSNANCSSTTGKARYLLTVTAADPYLPESGPDAPVIGLIFFGPAAEQVIGHPVETLIGKQEQGGTSIPEELKAACGKSFNLRVTVGNLSYQDQLPTYQVITIIGGIQPYTGNPSAPENKHEAPQPAQEGVSTNKDDPKLVQVQKDTKPTAPSTPAGQEQTAAPKKRSPETPDTIGTQKIATGHLSQNTPAPDHESVTQDTAQEAKTPKRPRTSAKKKLDFDEKRADATGKEQQPHAKHCAS